MTAALVPLDTGDDRLIDLWASTGGSRTAATTDAYGRDARQFLAFVGRPLREVNLFDVKDYADHLKARGLSEATQRRKVASVKSLLAFGARSGLLPVNVGAVVQLKRPRQNINERILTEAEVQRSFNLAPDPRTEAVLRLLYYTGARASEVAALRWSDITEKDTPTGRKYLITIQGKGEKERVVAVPKEKLSSALAVLRDLHAPTVAGWSRVTIWRAVKSAAERAGLTVDAEGEARHTSPHFYRHSAATHAIERGALLSDVSRQLGHASVETTVAFYVHSRPDVGLADYLP